MNGGATPPGWYPDPWYPGGLRWFDGARWTEHAGPGAVPLERYDAEKGRSTTQWAGAAFVARGILVGLQLVVIPLVFARFFDDVRAAVDNPDSTSSFGASYGLAFSLVAQIGGLVVWACLAAIMVWTYRATKNANLLGIETRFSPALAVCGWFIPLASLVMPYLAVRDLFPPGHSGRRAAGWWWAAEIAGGTLGIVAFGVAFFGSGPGLAVGMLAGGCAAAAGVLGYRLTRSVVAVHTEIARSIGAA